MAKHERKAWRQEQKDILDEMLPKATGRDATLEKKALRRDEMRERERGGSPEMTRLIGGGDIMGGDDSFAAAKAEAKARCVVHVEGAGAADHLWNSRLDCNFLPPFPLDSEYLRSPGPPNPPPASLLHQGCFELSLLPVGCPPSPKEHHSSRPFPPGSPAGVSELLAAFSTGNSGGRTRGAFGRLPGTKS